MGNTFRVAVTMVALVSVACGEKPKVELPPEVEVDAGTLFVAAPPQWTSCPLHSEGTGPLAECAVIATPLNRADPQGPTIEVYVKRFKPAGGRSLRALWMLQGGPGASGHVFESLSEQIATRFPDIDFYMPDHRGTGRSTRLGCAAQEASGSEGALAITAGEWPTCLAEVKAREGQRLAAFNTTNAANDLGLVIEAARQPGQPLFVYGVSYGTYWAQRYLQLFPQQADGVVFDSIAPQGTSLARQDADANEAARDFLRVCGADAVCSQKLGADPAAKAEALFVKLKAGHCPDIAVPDAPTYVLFRRAFGSLLMDANLRPFISAIIYRADRCEPRDVAALKVLMANLTQPQPETLELKLWSWVLTYNILMSELLEQPAPSVAELKAIRENAIASRDVTEGMEVHLGTWPTYARDGFAQTWADTETPVLFLQGGLDPATLLRKAREAKPHFTRPHQHWVEFATATHTSIASSVYVSDAGEARSCGTRVLMNFIENPTGELDVTCVAKVRPIDFRLQRVDLNQALFGTNDAWE